MSGAILHVPCDTDVADAAISEFVRVGGVGLVDLVTLSERTVAYPAGEWDRFAAMVKEWNEANAKKVT